MLLWLNNNSNNGGPCGHHRPQLFAADNSIKCYFRYTCKTLIKTRNYIHIFSSSIRTMTMKASTQMGIHWYGYSNAIKFKPNINDPFVLCCACVIQSDSTFVPLKADQISGTESDDSSIRSVRFSKLAEVREMSPHEATEALLSRLSYAASLRVRSQKTHNRIARTALMFCVLVSGGHPPSTKNISF